MTLSISRKQVSDVVLSSIRLSGIVPLAMHVASNTLPASVVKSVNRDSNGRFVSGNLYRMVPRYGVTYLPSGYTTDGRHYNRVYVRNGIG